MGKYKLALHDPAGALNTIPFWGIFCDWKLPSGRDIELLELIRFESVILGVGNKYWDESKGLWKPAYTEKRIVDTAKELTYKGFRVHIMPWAIRSKAWIEQAVPWFTRVAESSGAYSVLLDAEKQWHIGTYSAAKAAKLVKEIVLDRPNVLLGVTGLAKLQSPVFPLAAMADVVVPQAYSIWRPLVSSHWSHSKSTFPGVQQALAYKSWMGTGREQGTLIMGLSNYWGARPAFGRYLPSITQEQALVFACAETSRLGVSEAWWWSLKWLMRKTRTAESMRRLFGVWDFWKEV
jgi:hypothetical protein